MARLADYVPVDHVSDGIYISGWRATLFRDDLRGAGILHVLKLYEDTPYFPADFHTFENALDDGELVPAERLTRGVQFVLAQVADERPVLVMCGAGISRSSTFVLAALLERGHDLRAAYRLLRRQHPEALPHPNLWRSLIAHYALPYTLAEAWGWAHNPED